MIFTHEITLDTTFNEIKTINIKQYTKDSFLLHVNLTDRGEPFHANKTTHKCHFKMETPDKKHNIFTDGFINDDGTVDILIPEKACLAAGNGTAELIFVESEIASIANAINADANMHSDKSVTESAENSADSYGNHSEQGTVFATMNLNINIVASSYSNSHITSSDDFDALHSALLAANKTYDYVMTSANASANAAKESEVNALTSERNAAASAKNTASSERNAKTSESNAASSERNAASSAKNAASSERNAASSALLSESYAVGGTGLEGRENEDVDCAKHYYEQCALISEGLKGGLMPMGTITSANIPDLETTTIGWMYNISDEFITDNNFHEGPGLTIPAGSNIYKTANGKWDVLAGSPVTGVKGYAEGRYRKGNVNITPANIGVPSNEYMEEHFVPDYVSSARGNIGNQGIGWYRIAQAISHTSNEYYGHSCVVSIKRGYNSPSPEYQKFQVMDSYQSQKISPIASFTGSDGTHMFTKVRKTWDSVNQVSYIEIYQDRNAINGIVVSVEDAIGNYANNWKVISPVKTEETVSGVTILASLDLPANFDSSYLAKKDGSNANGTWGINISGSATRASQDSEGNVIKDSYAVRKTINSGDFNDLKTPGLYTMRNASENTPDGTGYYSLIVLCSDSANYVQQIAIKETTFDVYLRYYYGATTSWANWNKIITTLDNINLTRRAAGILPIANGGTGNSNGKLPYNKLLWGGSGGAYMYAGQTASLSEPISSQPHGIVLEFAEYINSSITNSSARYSFFIPKMSVEKSPTHSFIMSTGNFATMCYKTVHITDSLISGSDMNRANGTGGSGIKYDNMKFVLQYVFGV